MNNASEIRSILKDVALNGAVLVSTRKLLWLLGWGQDRPGAWRDLLDHWKEIGGDSANLHGQEVNELLLLTTNNEIEPITVWAKEK